MPMPMTRGRFRRTVLPPDRRVFGRHDARRPPRLGLCNIQLDLAREGLRRRGDGPASIVVVAFGEPGVPVICWADAVTPKSGHVAPTSSTANRRDPIT
jgi:hypothetical protein